MLITTKKITISLLTSTALSAVLALSPMTANAEANPFASAELSSSYLQLAEAAGDVEKSATEHQDAVMEDQNDAIENDEMTPEPGSAGDVEDSATKHQKSVTEDEMDSDKKATSSDEMENDMEEGDTGIKK